MLELKNNIGNRVVIYGDIVEQEAVDQVMAMANAEIYQNAKIRIMPDVHAGKSCTIGTTMTIGDKLTPNLVGVDIGCGMYVIPLGKIDLDLELLDKIINEKVPSGENIHPTPVVTFDELDNLRCRKVVDPLKANASIGTLGGGNHFIEANVDDDGNKYIVIHSGSRNLGVRVCNYYQKQAASQMTDTSAEVKRVIAELKAAGREREIQEAIKSIERKAIPTALAYVEGDLLNDYMHDMDITQRYAMLNRETMAHIIVKGLGLDVDWDATYHTIHNYIDIEHGILRKGSVSAQEDERLIIPMNMRDGSLICVGKGNPDWNYSAPHGAGRIMSRGTAKETVSLTEFEESMKGIYTTSVTQSTIDESPMVYKPMQEIINNISDTVDIINIIKPVYNFKASDA